MLSGSRAISSFQMCCFVVYDNLCVPTSEVCCVQDDWLRHPLGWCTSKEKPSRCGRCKAVIKDLLLFPVSSGDVCGKKTNPCGEDAICNQTNVNAVCQCKPGFKRNPNSGLCEGNAQFLSTSFWSVCAIRHLADGIPVICLSETCGFFCKSNRKWVIILDFWIKLSL